MNLEFVSTTLSDQYSDWDVYRFGLKVGLRTLPNAPLHGLKRLVLPVEYIRCAEFRYVLEHLDVSAGHSVLDIGSPKLLALFLAAEVGATVHATDLVDYFFQSYARYAEKSIDTRRGNFLMKTEDAQALTYPDETFDRVFSVSVIEHIPGDGDQVAMREIARVLKPGGVACITVPWRDDGYVEEFGPAGNPSAYWTTPAGDQVFYQRAYDAESLTRRLLDAAPLTTVDLSFWGERGLGVEDMLLSQKLPRAVHHAMLPLHFPLNRLFLSQMRLDEPARKKVACVTLQKAAR